MAGGITYYTVQGGLWSTPEDSDKFYRNIYNTVAPYVREHVNADILNEVSVIPC